MGALTLIQTADLHNRLGLAQAGRLRHLKTEHNALLLDCGDAIWAPNVMVKLGPEPIIRRMNEAGYDAMAMGNREFFFRAGGMLMKTAEANFPVLSANLIVGSGELSHIQRWTVLVSPGGDRVGVFGLTPTMIRPDSWPEVFANVRFISHERAVREALAALRPQCQWVVCLSHIGLQRDQQLAGQFPELDLILGGHSHTRTEGLMVVNGVSISHVGAFGKHVALITSVEAQRPSEFRRQLIALAGK